MWELPPSSRAVWSLRLHDSAHEMYVTRGIDASRGPMRTVASVSAAAAIGAADTLLLVMPVTASY
jgi:hypothetical protein